MAAKFETKLSEVQQALKDLHEGTKTMDEVNEFFANRTWPQPTEDKKLDSIDAIYRDMYMNDIPKMDPEGGIEELDGARMQGWITYEQETELKKVALKAINGKKGK